MRCYTKSIIRACRLFFTACLCGLALLGSLDAATSSFGPSDNETDQVIIKFRDKTSRTPSQLGANRMNALSAKMGVNVKHLRQMSQNKQILKLSHRMRVQDMYTILKQLAADPDIEYAIPDRVNRAMMVPNDPQYKDQWHYKEPATEIGGVNLPPAWDITTGNSGIVVAVLDTGITNHAEFIGRTVPGYDMIHDTVISNDGDSRDADPSDPGDWITQVESDTVNWPFDGCEVQDSSWHGTHVAGIIGAKSNNGDGNGNGGVAGINWGSKILPVRVLGKCGGYTTDIAAGICWAAGLHVDGIEHDNPYPAKVINLSLGGFVGGEPCDPEYQSAINSARAAGAVVVVSAGNGHPLGTPANVSEFQPAKCDGVIAVAATNRAGGRAYYSNYGSGITISAPGGQQFRKTR